MNKLFELTEEFIAVCNSIEVEFAFSIAESFYDGRMHNDANYRITHHEAFGASVDVFTKYRGKIPEPIFSDVFNELQETIRTNCGW